MVYYISAAAQLFQIFTQSLDAIDVTSVTLSRLNSINAIDITRCWLNVECSNVPMFQLLSFIVIIDILIIDILIMKFIKIVMVMTWIWLKKVSYDGKFRCRGSPSKGVCPTSTTRTTSMLLILVPLSKVYHTQSLIQLSIVSLQTPVTSQPIPPLQCIVSLQPLK